MRYVDVIKKDTITLSTDNPVKLFAADSSARTGWRCGVPASSATDLIFAVVGIEDPAPSRADMLAWNQFYVVPRGVIEDGAGAGCSIYVVRVSSVPVTLTPFEIFPNFQ